MIQGIGHRGRRHGSVPQDGVVWIVSGAGCTQSRVGRSSFTAHAESTLQFMGVSIDGETMEVRAITTDGRVIDEITVRADRAP
jgi:hypothetical protein